MYLHLAIHHALRRAKEPGATSSSTTPQKEKLVQSPHRRSLAAYVAADRYLNTCNRAAKTLTQMAAELGTTKGTVRRWLRRDHWDLWMEYWASADELWEEMKANRECDANSNSHKSRITWDLTDPVWSMPDSG
jgi:hypothetical protein